jgi:hypothetical protein
VKPLLALPLLLAACGPGQAYYQCPEIPNLGYVLSEMSIDCQAFASNSAIAFGMLDQANVVPLGSDHDFERWTVIVESGLELHGYPGTNGRTDISAAGDPTITLSSSAGSLLHEELHAWQTMHGDLDTVNHPNWCEMGWGAANDNDCPGSLGLRFRGVETDVSAARSDNGRQH